MNALTAHSKGHIYPIIDEERNTVLSSQLMKFLCGGDEMASIACLVSVLHERDAAAESSVDDVTDILVAKNRGGGVCY